MTLRDAPDGAWLSLAPSDGRVALVIATCVEAIKEVLGVLHDTASGLKNKE